MHATAYAFGFRKSELLDMKTEQVNIIDGTIRLWRGTTNIKSGEPRLVVLTPETKMLLTACCHSKLPDEHVFTRNDGRPMLDFRGAWDKLTEAAGLPGLLFHDLRRSAVRNMIRRGVPERVAMSISGHKTRHVFDRYNVVDERDLIEAARKIERGGSAQV